MNRAPVPTLWAAITAERLGPPAGKRADGGPLRGCFQRPAKARSLRIADKSQEATELRERAGAIKPQRQVVRLLGRNAPVLPADEGTMRADEKGQPASARGVRSYVMRAFGEVREAMEALAASLPPDELNRVDSGLRCPLAPRDAEQRGNCRLRGSRQDGCAE